MENTRKGYFLTKVCLKPLSSTLQQMLSADSEHKLGAEIMQNVF